jgi:hypothetical protein
MQQLSAERPGRPGIVEQPCQPFPCPGVRNPPGTAWFVDNLHSELTDRPEA